MKSDRHFAVRSKDDGAIRFSAHVATNRRFGRPAPGLHRTWLLHSGHSAALESEGTAASRFTTTTLRSGV